MMISRRPNTLASKEYAPGPRNKIFKSMVAANTADNLQSKGVCGHLGRIDSMVPAPPSATATAVTGVRKPITKRALARNAANPTSHAATEGSGSRK